MTTTIIGNKNGVYINPVNNFSYINPERTENYKDVNLSGVNHLVIKREDNGKMFIIQASGYTPEKGLFCELY